MGSVDRQLTAGELLDWVDERLSILAARKEHMRIYAVRDIDSAEVRRLEAFRDELTEMTLCAANDLTTFQSVETLIRDGETHPDQAANMKSTLEYAQEQVSKQ